MRRDTQRNYPTMITQPGHVEPMPRRLRAFVGDDAVVDTTEARYVWEHGFYPQYYLPPHAVPAAAVRSQDATEDSPVGTVALHTLVAGGREVLSAARQLTADTTLSGMAGWWRLEWNAFDRWLEEDEEVIVHPRSPYVRVDALPTSRRVRVELDGVVLADTDSAVLLFETGLPTRHYLPPADVHMEHLEPNRRRTSCPYKGTVSDYWNVRLGEDVTRNIAWRYTDTLREAAPISGMIAFHDELVDTYVDDVLQPTT